MTANSNLRLSDMKLYGLPRPRTEIMVNLGDPDKAFQTAMLPNDGVGLAGWNSSSTNSSASIPWPLANLDERSRTKKASSARSPR